MSEIKITGSEYEEQPTKLQSFGKFAIVTSLACSALLVITISSPISQKSNTSTTNLDTLGYIETKGRQPVKNGCANLYGSDWAMYPDTRAVVICNDNTYGTSNDHCIFRYDELIYFLQNL